MVEIKIGNRYLALLMIILASSVAVQSLNLNVKIAESADHRAVDLEKNRNFSNLHRVNFTVENTGSVGCVYRVRTSYGFNSTVENAWSQGHSLWPGETARVSTVKVLENRTGPVNVTVDINYCGSTERVDSFEGYVDAGTVDDSSFQNLVAEVDESSSRVYLDQESDLLVPVESPSLWKLSHSRIESGEAELRYDPPIFRERVLNYYLVDEGEVLGKTEIDLDREYTLSERLEVFIRGLQLNV